MKGINHKYIILQRRKLKIFLNAGSEPWEAPIGNEWYQIDVWLESLFASWIFDYGYVGYIGDIASYLAYRYNKGVTPVHVQHFIDYFKASHKVEKLDDCSLKDVFLLGDDIEGCPVPICKYDCAITKEDEQMLLGKIQNNQATAKKILEDFFSRHMIRFNQSYYPKWGEGMEAKYLAENFLAMHGIRIRDNQIQKKTTASDLWITALVCCIIITLLFTVAIFCGLLNGWTIWIVFFIASPCYFIMLDTSLEYSTTRNPKKKWVKKIKRILYKTPILPFLILWFIATFLVFPIMVLNKIDSFDNILGWVMFFMFSFGIYYIMVFYKRIINN